MVVEVRAHTVHTPLREGSGPSRCANVRKQADPIAWAEPSLVSRDGVVREYACARWGPKAESGGSGGRRRRSAERSSWGLGDVIF